MTSLIIMEPSLDMIRLNEKFLTQFLKTRKTDPNFKFVLRKTNRYSRLEKGYWFYGTEKYLTLSFWAGMDWQNRTPNIFFSINKYGECSLVVTASDAPDKYAFFYRKFYGKIKDLEIEIVDRSFVKNYTGLKHDVAFKLFLEVDKEIIDKVINNDDVEDEFGTDSHSGLGRITNKEFEKNLLKVNSYRIGKRNLELSTKANYLKSIKVKGYGSIKEVELKLKPGIQWVFFTGENGTGKSNLLKGIAVAVAGGIEGNSGADIFDSEIIAEFVGWNNIKKRVKRKFLKNEANSESVISGFAAYGPTRLLCSNEKYNNESLNGKKTHLTYNIFNHDGELISLESFINSDYIQEKTSDFFDLEESIMEALVQNSPSLSRIGFYEGDEDDISIAYYEKDKDNEFETGLSFDLLSSGMKTILGMLSDMMARLFTQQPHINDPAELCGIVLIDEIDIHLHPKMQKQIVLTLCETFPKIQFIVTTHSPIPLLGAPLNSCFYNVKRSTELGTYIEEINDVDIRQLTPNTILTSPIFGMQSILHYDNESNGDYNQVRTENSWTEMKVFDKEFDALVKKYKVRKGIVND